MKKINEWILTDNDSMQHVRCIVHSHDYPEQNDYEIIEMGLINPEENLYEVYIDTICVDDYLECMRSELSSILASYGYGDKEEDCAIIIDRMMEEYEKEVFQVVCECIFEYYGSFQALELFHGKEKECIDFIEKYVSEN